MEKQQKIQIVKDAIRSYPNFPKEGIIFRDIFSVFQNVTALRALKHLLVEHVLFLEVDVIVGLDSRGFLLGPLISVELGKPFVPIRKKGKLPGPVIQRDYSLEYGTSTLEITEQGISKGTRVLIVDDLLATGGTMAASVELLHEIGAVVVECLVVMEFSALKGRDKISVPVHSFITYD